MAVTVSADADLFAHRTRTNVRPVPPRPAAR